MKVERILDTEALALTERENRVALVTNSSTPCLPPERTSLMKMMNGTSGLPAKLPRFLKTSLYAV